MFGRNGKSKKWAGYVLYCVILMGVLLYYRFPSEVFKDYLQTTVANVDPRLLLSLDSIRPAIPIGLKLSQPELSIKGKPERPLFSAKSLFVGPELWSILKGKLTFRFSCEAYQGHVQGYVTLEKKSLKGPYDTFAEIKNVRIGDSLYLQDLLGRQVEGTLEGRVAFKGEYRLPMDGIASLNLRLSDGRLEFLNLHPLLNLGAVDFREIQIEGALEKRNLNLTRLQFKGGPFNGTLTGSIRLNQIFLKSRLKLRGKIQLSAAFLKSIGKDPDTMKFIQQRMKKGTLTIDISGTFSDPKVRFI